MPGIDEIWVRQRAHEIWVAEGMPEGKDFDHWCAATEEFRALPVKKPAARKVASGAEGGEKPAAKPARKTSAKAAAVSEALPVEVPAKKKAPAVKKPKA